MSGTTPGGQFRYPYELDSLPEVSKACGDDIDKMMDRDRALEDYLTGATGADVDGDGVCSVDVHNSACGNAAGGGDFSVVVGDGSAASGENSIAIGNQAGAFGESAIAIGTSSAADEDFSTAIGDHAAAFSPGATAIGTNASAGAVDTDSGQIAIGVFATAPGQDSIAIGTASDTNNGENSIAIGSAAVNNNDRAISIGFNSAGGEDGVAIGSSASAGSESAAIGANAEALSAGSFATPGASVPATIAAQSVALGYGAVADDIQQIMMGSTDHFTVIPGADKFILTSPDTTRWIVSIDNAGVISTSPA